MRRSISKSTFIGLIGFSRYCTQPTRVAMEEIAQDQIKWQMTPPVEEPTALGE